jgi:hypothetical protein
VTCHQLVGYVFHMFIGELTEIELKFSSSESSAHFPNASLNLRRYLISFSLQGGYRPFSSLTHSRFFIESFPGFRKGSFCHFAIRFANSIIAAPIRSSLRHLALLIHSFLTLQLLELAAWRGNIIIYLL